MEPGKVLWYRFLLAIFEVDSAQNLKKIQQVASFFHAQLTNKNIPIM